MFSVLLVDVFIKVLKSVGLMVFKVLIDVLILFNLLIIMVGIIMRDINMMYFWMKLVMFIVMKLFMRV